MLPDRPGLLVPPWTEIELSNGEIALIDLEDAPRVLQHRWHAQVRTSGSRVHRYACANVSKDLARQLGVQVRDTPIQKGRERKKQITRITLHQFIMGRRPGLVCDHRNGNPLDCRRHNLRWASPGGNATNRRKQSRPATSMFKGVSWNKEHERWVAQIRHLGVQKHLGYFCAEDDAARAYDAAARSRFGEFARLNFPND